MDLLKLVAELRVYRAQVEEAIAAMEDLARRRHLSGDGPKLPKSPQRRGPKPSPTSKSSALKKKSS